MSNKPLVALLDGHDCEFEGPVLEKYANVAFCGASNMDEIDPKVLDEAVAVITAHSLHLTAADIDRFKKLRLIICLGVGFDHVDFKHAASKKIPVCNVPAYGVEEIADTAICHILTMYRRTFWLSNAMKDGAVIHGFDQVKAAAAGAQRIRGCTLGMIGLGHIGKAVAMRAKAFGFRVSFYDPYLSDGEDKALAIDRVHTIDELLQQADCLTLHCPGNKANHHLINREFINKMKKGSFIVNTARGTLIDEAALCEALKSGQLRAAALDVFEAEPYVHAESPLKDAPNLIITPHSAFYSDQSIVELRESGAKEIKHALKAGLEKLPEGLKNCVNKRFFDA